MPYDGRIWPVPRRVILGAPGHALVIAARHTIVVHRTPGSYSLDSVRLSPGYFNTKDEIDQTIGAIVQIAQAKL